MKKIITLLSSLLVVACGGDNSAPTDANTTTTNTNNSIKTEVVNKEIKIAASVTPHSEILNEAKKILEKEGFTLDVQIFNDYVQPNFVVESGDFLANFVEHRPFLKDINAKSNLHLVDVASIHYEPFGIYPGKTKTLSEVSEGAKVAVPNDPTNEARALLLLEANNLIKLKENTGIDATINDIAENPNKIEILEVEAAQIPRLINEVDLAVINGNYAIDAGFSVSKDAIAYEKADSLAAKTYENVIVVKQGNENDPRIQALVKALTSKEIRDFITNKYDGAVIPAIIETATSATEETNK